MKYVCGQRVQLIEAAVGADPEQRALALLRALAAEVGDRRRILVGAWLGADVGQLRGLALVGGRLLGGLDLARASCRSARGVSSEIVRGDDDAVAIRRDRGDLVAGEVGHRARLAVLRIVAEHERALATCPSTPRRRVVTASAVMRLSSVSNTSFAVPPLIANSLPFGPVPA